MIADGVPEIALRDETFGQILTKPWNRPMLYPIELWVPKSPETSSGVGDQFCLVFAPIARGEKRNRPKLGRLAGRLAGRLNERLAGPLDGRLTGHLASGIASGEGGVGRQPPQFGKLGIVHLRTISPVFLSDNRNLRKTRQVRTRRTGYAKLPLALPVRNLRLIFLQPPSAIN